MKIIATSEELKDLRNLFIQGFTSLDEQDRTELEQEIKIKDKLIKELNNDNDTLLSYQKELETTNNNYKTEYMALAIDVQNLKTENTTLISKLDKKRTAETILENRIKQLFSSNNAHKSEKQKLQSINRELEEKTKELEKGITYWKTQSKEIALAKNPNEELQKENQELKEQLQLKNEVINKIHNDNKKLTAANNGLYMQANKIKQDKKLNSHWLIHQDKINALMFKLASIINKEYPYNTKFTTLDNLHENIIQVIKFMQSKIYDLENKNKELVAEYESLEQKKINLEVEVESLNSEFNDIKQVLKQSNKELKDELNLSNEVIELQANLIEATKALRDMTVERDNLGKEIINTKAEIIKVLDKYAENTQHDTKYIHINILKDIKQYL